MIDKIKKQYQKIYNTLWLTDINTMPRKKQLLLRTGQIVILIIRDVTQGLLPLRAMSLVYTTLLSIVPLLALSFSVLKGFGVHNQLKPMLLNILTPLGEQGVEIAQNIILFVENMKVGVLGALGLTLLLYTVVSMIQKVETSFNYTWRVSTHRSFIQRFSNYLSLTLVGPVLIFSTIALTASVASSKVLLDIMTVPVIGVLVEFGGRLLPYLLIITAFTFFYIFVPNTKVKFVPALTGAVVAGLLWETAGWIFTSFVVGATKYAAIYSALATLIVFMVWLYASWAILLVGTNIAFYVQNPQDCTLSKTMFRLSSRQREKVALLSLALIGKHYYQNMEAWTSYSLAEYLALPQDVLQKLLAILIKANILAETADDPPKILPARAAENILLKDIINILRSEDESSSLNKNHKEETVDNLYRDMEQAINTSLGNKTLKDITNVELATK